MADDTYGPGAISIDDLGQKFADTLRGSFDGLAARRLTDARMATPGGIAVSVGHGQVGVGPPLPLTLPDLDESRIRLDLDAYAGPHRVRGLARAGQGRAHDARGSEQPVTVKAARQELSLEMSLIGERWIGVSLESTFAVPVGDAVSNQEKETLGQRTTAVSCW